MHILTQPPGYVSAAGNHILRSKAPVYFSFVLLPGFSHMVIDAREADKVVSFFSFFSFYSGRGKREERRKEFG